MPLGTIELLGFLLLGTGVVLGGSAAAGRALVAIPEAIGIAVLVCVAMREVGAGPARRRTRLWIVAVVLALPALQLVPLPPPIWVGLPGRAAFADAYAAAGMPAPWLPVSLTPNATERFLLGLLPAAALVLALPHLPREAHRRLLHAAIVLGVLDALLGLVQLAGGPQSPLRFYGAASRTDAVGFFANRNHHAAFLALLLVLTGGLVADRAGSRGERIWLASAAGTLLLGIASSGSRAGLLLGIGASLASAWCILAGRSIRPSRRSLAAWSAIAIVPFLLGLLVFGAAAIRLQTGSLADDLRGQIARTTWRALVDVFPVGAGFGSFERVYARFERLDEIVPAIVNNAHDDWLELVLEGGLPALLLLIAAAAALVRGTVAADPRPDRPEADRAMRSAALAVLWLCALHSTVDYPLRVIAVNLVLALACAIRIGPLVGGGPAVRIDPASTRPRFAFGRGAAPG